MTSNDFLYVWAWLPHELEPVPVGTVGLDRGKEALEFAYATSYRSLPGAIPIAPMLPLSEETYRASGDLLMPAPLRDAMPDAWGRRVLQHANPQLPAADGNPHARGELAYMLASGTNRFGGLDFQESHSHWVPRETATTLDELHDAARRLEQGLILSPELDSALVHGTTIGGARPKALVQDNDRQYIAKFTSSSDTIPVIKAEAAALYLAESVGITVPSNRVVESLGRFVLLVERFDRVPSGGRRLTVSALTLSGYDEMRARYATYLDFLNALIAYQPLAEVGPQLFDRIAFNMAISNSDDHARNHAAFWDGQRLDLTPAYDLAPNSRTGETASQAMAYAVDSSGVPVKESNFARLIEYAPTYGLNMSEARDRIDHLVTTVNEQWEHAADHGRLTRAERDALWGRQFLNPGVLFGM